MRIGVGPLAWRPLLKYALTTLAFLLLTTDAYGTTVLMLTEPFPGSSAPLRSKLKKAVAAAGFRVSELTGSELSARLDAEQGPGCVLLLPDSRYFPADAKQALVGFLKRRNHLMAVSGPALENQVVRSDGRWLTKPQTKDELAKSQGEAILDFTSEDLSKWQRCSGKMENKTEYCREESGDPRVPTALHADISRLDDWETYVGPRLAKPFPDGFTATVFWAKGGPNTPELILEWREKDASRWMGVVKISTQWKRYVLTPDDFKFWGDGSPSGRGSQGDKFNPANAEAISFGLASGISSQRLGIAHSFWVSDVRAVKDRFAAVDFRPPVLESISPAYKTYRTFAARAELAKTGEKLPAGDDVVCAIPRGKGLASEALRKSRYVPIIRVRDSKGEPRGMAAHLYLNTANDFSGSIWGFVGCDQQFIERNAKRIVPVIVSMLDRIRTGVFLANAGTEFFAYLDGETAKTGAYVINLTPEPVKAKVDFVIAAEGRFRGASSGEAVIQPLPSADADKLLTPVAGESVKLPPGEYTIRASLSIGGKPVDEIAHQFMVVKYPELSDKNTVSVREGQFVLDGKPWHALGVNYWPRYVTGLESGSFWVHWLSPEQYDPEIVEQDLALAQDLGMMMLSIQYMKPPQARTLMDFLARCERRGIKANIYVPGLHPLAQDFATANALIAEAHLAEDPGVFAYDVGWEVHVGRYEARKQYDKQWQQWVVDRYGSVESAEADWKYKPDRVSGIITGPKDDQLTGDGEWRAFVAAYRRFWDDELGKRYRAVQENAKQLDNHHLIGARSGWGGTGTMWSVPALPFDLASGVKHLDFTSPEGYGLTGDRLGYLKGGLTTLYGKFVSGGKPVYWAEYGFSVWPRVDADLLEQQRECYENMLNMTYQSGANGSAGWWWPGGLRLGEVSDYGIVSPDGTPRPAALEFRKFAKRLKTAQTNSASGHAITIDRDLYVTGYAGISAAHTDEYVRAVEAGERPTLRTDATGKTSADVPLTAVGNVPCNGSNPPKYLNSEFNYVLVNG